MNKAFLKKTKSCRLPGCGNACYPRKPLCDSHWGAMPRDLRDAILQARTSLQRARADGAALVWYAKAENRREADMRIEEARAAYAARAGRWGE